MTSEERIKAEQARRLAEANKRRRNTNGNGQAV